jgi:hypothetical protein
MLELLGALIGGGFRLVPEILKLLDAKAERAHELARLDKQFDFQKLTGQQKIEEAVLDANTKFDVAAFSALAESVKGQSQLTGNPFIDGLNMTVRPVVTYTLLALYVLSKLAALTLGTANGLNTWESILAIYTAEDRALFSGILTFWFINRTLRNGSH